MSTIRIEGCSSVEHESITKKESNIVEIIEGDSFNDAGASITNNVEITESDSFNDADASTTNDEPNQHRDAVASKHASADATREIHGGNEFGHGLRCGSTYFFQYVIVVND